MFQFFSRKKEQRKSPAPRSPRDEIVARAEANPEAHFSLKGLTEQEADAVIRAIDEILIEYPCGIGDPYHFNESNLCHARTAVSCRAVCSAGSYKVVGNSAAFALTVKPERADAGELKSLLKKLAACRPEAKAPEQPEENKPQPKGKEEPPKQAPSPKTDPNSLQMSILRKVNANRGATFDLGGAGLSQEEADALSQAVGNFPPQLRTAPNRPSFDEQDQLSASILVRERKPVDARLYMFIGGCAVYRLTANPGAEQELLQSALEKLAACNPQN